VPEGTAIAAPEKTGGTATEARASRRPLSMRGREMSSALPDLSGTLP
jgi:hypothetical protein